MMVPMKKTLILLLLWALAPNSALAVEGDGHHSLWKATGPKGGTVYLLGSVHVLPESASPLPDVITSSFEASSTTVFEVDFDAMNNSAQAIFSAGSLLPGETLEDMLSPDTAKMLKSHLGHAGLNPEMFKPMRPWMAALALTSFELVKHGYSPDAGIDITLARRATEAEKTIIALESAEEQISLFSNLSDSQSEAFLRYTIRDLRTLSTQLDTIIEAWKHGDVQSLRKLLGEAFLKEPEVLRRFVTARNEKWMTAILSLFEKDRVSMVVVGTLHLVGDQGILEKLKKAGIHVEQL